MCLLSHFFSESTEAMEMKLCIGPQPDVTQVLKYFGVATLPNTAARAQKLAKLVSVPMSDKNVPMSDKLSLRMSNKNVHKVKLVAGGRRSLRVNLKMKKSQAPNFKGV